MYVIQNFLGSINRKKAKLPWNGQSCHSPFHKTRIHIETQGKQDFIDETDGEFPPERWIDGFSWIDIDLKCTGCGMDTRQWVSFETM